MCGALRLADAGKKVVLMGWMNRRRDLGQIIFVDLRDRSGITQVVFNHELNAAVHDKAQTLRNEFVIAVIGTVKKRDADTINKNIPTGEVELVAEELRILNVSKQLPFLPSDIDLANEEMRLKYRYIDLRRDAMQFNIALRHKVALAIRDYLASQGFFEIETPFMTRSTPKRAELPRPEPSAAWDVLRAAAVAATVQADPHDLGIRSLFPDRPLLPRRRFARRPAA
jgi:aspartyl-tRNA synthetase